MSVVLLQKIKIWITLSRPSFLATGILPFIVGSLLSMRMTHLLNVPVFLWGLSVVVFVMISTYFNGEVYDIDGDRLTVNLEKNNFSGGTQVLVNGLVSSNTVNRASFFSLAIALLIALLLRCYYHTGPWTILLICTGAIAGFYYSKPPYRWVQRGLGEVFIGYSYGWLAVAVGAYLQVGHIDPLVHWVSLPIICSVFNVILINEFPDYPADIQVHKRNLVVRLGKGRCAIMYVVVAMIGIVAFMASLTKGFPQFLALCYLPVGICSCVAIVMMLMKKFNDRKSLEKLCLMTYVVNVGIGLVYIVGFLSF